MVIQEAAIAYKTDHYSSDKVVDALMVRARMILDDAIDYRITVEA